MNEVPSLREELDRKSIETLEWLVHGHATGLLDDVQLSSGVNTLWKAVAGLVAEDVKDLIGDAGQMAHETPPMVRRFFWKKELMVVERQVQQSVWHVSKPLRNPCLCGFSSRSGCESPAHAKETMDAFCAKLIEHGWREL